MKFTGCCYCRLEVGVRPREKEMFMAEMEENPLLLLLFTVLDLLKTQCWHENVNTGGVEGWRSSNL
jgi:hypothetical protein